MIDVHYYHGWGANGFVQHSPAVSMYVLQAALTCLLLQPGVNTDIGTGTVTGNLLGSAVGTFVTTLVVGAILVAVAPAYVEDRMTTLSEEPLGSLLYGIICLIGVVLVTVILVITIVGVIFAVPFAILAGLIWADGAAIAYLAIAVRLVNRDDGWLKPLLVAAALSGGLTLTGIGGVVSLCIGAAGFGAVVKNIL